MALRRGALWLCVLGVVVACGAAAAGASAKPQTISLLEVDTGYAGVGGYNITSNAAPAPGQGVTFSGRLFHWAGDKRGAAAGSVQAVCTVTPTGGGICQGVITLAAGTLALVGPTNLGAGPSNIPIVGGTGAYVGASGYMHSHDLGGPNSSESADVLHITG
jgi:hypothetical protein